MFKYLLLTFLAFNSLGFQSAAAVTMESVPVKANLNATKTPVIANVCGNGIVEEGEACDSDVNCSADCKGGIYHTDAPGEETPKFQAVSEVPEFHPAQNQQDTTYGPANSGQESGHELAPVDKPDFAPLPGPAKCGNATVEAGEDCDDGNTLTGDGCDSYCHFEEASDHRPLVDKTPRPPAGGEDSAITLGGQAMVSGAGCALQYAADSASRNMASLISLFSFALPALFRSRSKKS